MKWIEYFGKLIPFVAPYPIWVKIIISIWVVFTAVSIIGLLFFKEPQSVGTTNGDRLDASVKSIPILTAGSLKQLRATNEVRELMPLENDKNISQLPIGIYGFTVPWIINSNPSGIVGGTGAERISLSRKNLGTAVMEVHKSRQGNIYIVGFTSQEALLHLQDPSRVGDLQLTVFLVPYQEFTKPVALPIQRIASSYNRTVEDISVNDIVFH